MDFEKNYLRFSGKTQHRSVLCNNITRQQTHFKRFTRSVRTEHKTKLNTIHEEFFMWKLQSVSETKTICTMKGKTNRENNVPKSFPINNTTTNTTTTLLSQQFHLIGSTNNCQI